jgi:hypothetical protein
MNKQVIFKSAAFPKYPNEDDELINSNCWGKRLAEWVRDASPKQGIQTGDLDCEDWGWRVEVKNEAFPLAVCCGVMDEFDEETGELASAKEGSDRLVQFTIFVAAEPTFIQRIFKRVKTEPAVAKIGDSLRALVESNPQITEVEWTT